MTLEAYWISRDDEYFENGPHASRDEAIATGRKDWPGGQFFVGRQGEYYPFLRDFVEELLELEACDVGDDCGPDASDDWPPRIGKEERDAANVKIKAILVELCGQCSMFPIVGSECIEAEAAVVGEVGD